MSTPLFSAVTDYIECHGGGEGFYELPMEGAHIIRSFHQVDANHGLYRPSLCVAVQGGKEFLSGSETFRYGTMQGLIISMDTPAAGRIVAASADKPFIGLTVGLDATILRDVLNQLDHPPEVPRGGETTVFVADIDEALADCLTRLVRLTERPEAIPVLYTSILREIYFWLLTGPHGGEVCRQALPETHVARISRAIWLLRENFTQSLPVEQLASAAGMSNSSFHHHFKSLTSMTPLQFQKQLRLLEARRLMLSDAFNVTDAAYRVGYESVSQFSREYSRAFGTAPKRDSMGFRLQLNELAPA
jgi:AraC-like DNA-binding protein